MIHAQYGRNYGKSKRQADLDEWFRAKMAQEIDDQIMGKEKDYPFGIDDLVEIDGVWQVKPIEKFYADVRFGIKPPDLKWINIDTPA